MTVEKFSISLPEDLVSSVDEIAEAEGLTRSAIIREATTDYVVKRRSAEYAEARRQRIDEAIRGFEELADELARLGPDERSSLDYLHEIRGDIGPDEVWEPKEPERG